MNRGGTMVVGFRQPARVASRYVALFVNTVFALKALYSSKFPHADRLDVEQLCEPQVELIAPVSVPSRVSPG
jgi:hypothetical protein